GVALVLLQEPAARARALSRARPVHPADEAEEHAALDAGRGADHPPGTGVLRLAAERGRTASCPGCDPGAAAAGRLLTRLGRRQRRWGRWTGRRERPAERIGGGGGRRRRTLLPEHQRAEQAAER